MASAVLLKSIGCRTNQEEMAALGSALAGRGYVLVDRLADADVVVVNTCVVTSVTEAKTRRFISSLSRARPGIKICVTGCLAQLSPCDIKKRLPATWVVGNSRKHEIPDILSDDRGGVFHGDACESGPLPIAVLHPAGGSARGGSTRFFLKIQEGCNCRCAYCIVPQVRGPSRSVPFSDITSAFRNAVDAGYKEIVLTGTHIGQYSDGGSRKLGDLVAALADTPGDFRLRLSSVDPRELTDALLCQVATHPKICPHVHLSVQSLCREILAAMNRPLADIDAFLRRLTSFRRAYPQVAIGGDFIVGFPGETERQFAATRDAVRTVGFSYGHVFRFSGRPGTPAAALQDQVDEKEKNARSAALRETLDNCHGNFVRNVSREVHTILVESTDPASGLAGNYLRMEIPGRSAPKNTWLRATITTLNPVSGRCVAAAVA